MSRAPPCSKTGHVLSNVRKLVALQTNEQERPLMQSIKGRRLIVYACVICKIFNVPAETFYHMTYSTNHFERTV